MQCELKLLKSVALKLPMDIIKTILMCIIPVATLMIIYCAYIDNVYGRENVINGLWIFVSVLTLLWICQVIKTYKFASTICNDEEQLTEIKNELRQ